jgi:AraC-like DNA-binding protein
MLGTRHEEYVNFSNNIPFISLFDLKRSRTNYSTEINWHGNTEIQLCTQGEGFVILGGRKIKMGEGDVVIANPNILHYTGTNTKITYDCIILDTEFCKMSGIDLSKICFEEHFKDEVIVTLFQKIKKEKDNNDLLKIARMRELILRLLIVLCESHISAYDIGIQNKNAHRLVTETITYIRGNYQKKLSLEGIAKNVFSNKYTLSRAFKEMTGQTVVEYINSYRCSQAAQLIRDGILISDSARLCGFSNMSFFTKTFKQYIGSLPSEYRKKLEV